MSRAQQTLLLAKREFLMRARSKVFLISMGLIVVLILAAGPIISLLQEDPEPISIGLVGSQPERIEDRIELRAALSERQVELTRYASTEEAETALQTGSVDVLLVNGTEVVFNDEQSFVVTQVLNDSIATSRRLVLMQELGLSESEMEELTAPIQLSVRTLVVADPEEEPRQAGAFIGMLFLYMAILIFGQFVAMGTVEEKQNRVVEIVLSRVKASQLLIGKVVGIGALGLLQLVVLSAAVLFVVNIVKVDGVSLPSIGAEIVGGVILWFLLGYTLYAFMYAALGATVSRQEDLQGSLVLPVIFILPGFFVAQLAVQDPDLAIVKYGSFFPPWTPMVMPIRSATGAASVGEVGLSVVLVVLAIMLLVWVGARVYTGALLRTGGKVKLREAWKSADS